MGGPIANLILTRLAIYSVVAERRGNEEWTEEHASAVVYLVASSMVMGGPLSAETLSGLDAQTCATFAERMQRNGMIAEELISYWEDKEEGGFRFELDVAVLIGLMERGTMRDGEPTYKMTERGRAEVEGKLLDEAKGTVN